MNVHYTGRHLEVPPQVGKQVEARLRKVKKVLGPRPTMETHVIVTLIRHAYRVEITVNLRDSQIVGVAETADLQASLKEALDRLEGQALKQKARRRVKRRHARPVHERSIRTMKVSAA